MQYEIKNISLSSVLKMSFLSLLTTGTIFFTFTTLMILNLANNLTKSMEEMGEIGVDTFAEMSLGGIVTSSFVLGVLISIGLVFWLSLIVIFYNFFAKMFGGVVMEVKEK